MEVTESKDFKRCTNCANRIEVKDTDGNHILVCRRKPKEYRGKLWINGDPSKVSCEIWGHVVVKVRV